MNHTITNDEKEKNELSDQLKSIIAFEDNKDYQNACETIGIVLKYFLSAWIEKKDPMLKQKIELYEDRDTSWNDISWINKMKGYIEEEKVEIGNYHDWNIVYTIFKDADTSNKNPLKFKKRHYEALSPIFYYILYTLFFYTI